MVRVEVAYVKFTTVVSMRIRGAITPLTAAECMMLKRMAYS
jgi:hypothetical protein